MPNALAKLYSWADGVKRRVSNPLETILLGLTRAGEDFQQASQDADVGYGLNGMRSVLVSPEQKAAAAQRAADFGAQHGMAAATVWHGSPHKFDKFDSSKIGTGEGAQAYGHGLYFADSQGVAKSYRDNLSAGNDPRDWIGNIASVLGKSKKTAPQDIAAEFRRYGQTAQLADNQDVVTLAKRMADGYEWSPHMGETWTNDAMNAMQRLDAMLPKSPPGSLYKVDLPDATIARMLDWDKPLSQQAPNVKDALQKLKAANPSGYQKLIDAQLGGPLMDQAVGRDLYKALGHDAFSGTGIPGIRYLDGGSRGAGQGTSNYVVFPGNEDILTILERNGVPVK